VNVGNYDLAHIDAAQNIPVSDELAFRVAAMREDRHGYFTNDGYSSHVAAFRVKGLYEPTENVSIQLLLDYSHQTGLWATTVPAPLPFAGPPPSVYNSTSDPKCAGPSGGWLITQPNNPWYVDPCHPADSIDYKFETVALQCTNAIARILLRHTRGIVRPACQQGCDFFLDRRANRLIEGGARILLRPVIGLPAIGFA